MVEFSESIINGVGGLKDFEHYEMAVSKYERDITVAMWVLKCLSNPDCKGAEEALQAIIERRSE